MKPALRPDGSAGSSLASTPDPCAFVEEVLRARAGASHTLVVTVPAPLASPVAVWRLAQAEPTAFFWQPPEGAAAVGWGACHVLEPSGGQRGAQVRRGAQAMAEALEVVGHPASPAPSPRWWGGLSFAPGTASRAPWTGFGDGRFVLPRWCYGRRGADAWLSMAVDGRYLAKVGQRQALGHLRHLLDAIGGRPDAPEGAPVPPAVQVAHADRNTWRDQVRAAHDIIAGGALEKVVVARCSEVRAASPIESAAALSRLGAYYPGCTRFAVRCDDATFVGATPERLVARHGSRALSEAMAGSVPHGAAASLLASEKDRREHALVVAAIVDGLRPFCSALEQRPEPEARELPNVVHLRTPVAGRLVSPVHVLDLVDALHPTPAVGGVPVEQAVPWILAHERAPRGWYSGPVGWFDAHGDGELAVALRSGLLRGDRAWVYAGAGIVRGSTPETEYAETALKLRPVLDALGAGAGGAEV